MGLQRLPGGLQVGGTHAIVDVAAIGLTAHGVHGGPEFLQQRRGNGVSSAMRSVDHHAQATQVVGLTPCAFTKFDVASGRIVETAGLAKLVRGRPRRGLLQLVFDRLLPRVG